jgi:hypothetical protein
MFNVCGGRTLVIRCGIDKSKVPQLYRVNTLPAVLLLTFSPMLGRKLVEFGKGLAFALSYALGKAGRQAG